MKLPDKNSEKEKILSKLIHFPDSSFSELFDGEIESNQFNYYLKELVKEGLVEKNPEGKYSLTEQGRKDALFIDGETGKRGKQPLAALIIVPANEKGELLAHHRKKEPFFDFFGFMGGKIQFGETILGCAARELKEETGLEGELSIAAIYNFLTFDEKGIAYHHLQFLIKAENCTGELQKENREGHFEWLPKEKIAKKKKLFVDVPHLIETIEKGKFKIVECERQMRNGEFVSMRITKETTF